MENFRAVAMNTEPGSEKPGSAGRQSGVHKGMVYKGVFTAL